MLGDEIPSTSEYAIDIYREHPNVALIVLRKGMLCVICGALASASIMLCIDV